MEDLALHAGSTTVHWEYNTNYIYAVEARIFTPRFKYIDIPACFLQEKLTMVFLLQNMRSLTSFRNICVQNHVQVQLSVGVLNG